MMNGELLTFVTNEKEGSLGLDQYFSGITLGSQFLSYDSHQTIFCQGDPADAVFLIRRGQVKVTVVSFAGNEATLSVLGPREFFGVGCLSHQTHRMNSASTLERTDLVRVEKNVMSKALREHSQLFDAFLADVMSRTVSLQKDLCTQINPGTR